MDQGVAGAGMRAALSGMGPNGGLQYPWLYPDSQNCLSIELCSVTNLGDIYSAPGVELCCGSH